MCFARATNPLTLCSLPLELREDIYAHLLLPEHVYSCEKKKHNDSNSEAYLDSRIYLPTRLPSNILQTCRQLKEECTNFVLRHLNSPFSEADPGPEPWANNVWDGTIKRQEEIETKLMENFHDENMVRITLEVEQVEMKPWGSKKVNRIGPSPQFMATLPFLSRIRRIKFIVWAGYDWWSGRSEPTHQKVERLQRAQFKRTSSDQDDELLAPSQWKQIPLSSRSCDDNVSHGPLSKALATLLDYLPLVSDIHVDVLMSVPDYLNWDLPEQKWNCVEKWLHGPLACSTKAERERIATVQRRLITVGLVGPPKVFSKVFFRQREERSRDGNMFNVKRGYCDVGLQTS